MYELVFSALSFLFCIVSSLLLASVPYAKVFLARVIGSDESVVRQNLGGREREFFAYSKTCSH